MSKTDTIDSATAPAVAVSIGRHPKRVLALSGTGKSAKAVLATAAPPAIVSVQLVQMLPFSPLTNSTTLSLGLL